MLCIISSGLENINLVKLCQYMSLSYDIFLDSEYRPYEDKQIDKIIERTIAIIDRLTNEWYDNFLVHPIVELTLLQKWETKYKNMIMPLFTNYLDYCLKHSLIGKIWLLWWYSDISQIESIWKDITKEFVPNENQTKIKKFILPPAKWTKQVSMRNYLLRSFSPRQMMINKIIKMDLRYFKDANIDTIIPLEYSYFLYQRTISWFFNAKKQKFHKREILQNIFKNITSNLNTITKETLTIFHTWGMHLLTDHKKTEWLISQWKGKSIEYKEINL